MKPYWVTYTECDDVRQTVKWHGYDASHAEERFFESMAEDGGMQGVRILSVALASSLRKPVRKAERPRNQYL